VLIGVPSCLNSSNRCKHFVFRVAEGMFQVSGEPQLSAAIERLRMSGREVFFEHLPDESAEASLGNNAGIEHAQAAAGGIARVSEQGLAILFSLKIDGCEIAPIDHYFCSQGEITLVVDGEREAFDCAQVL